MILQGLFFFNIQKGRGKQISADNSTETQRNYGCLDSKMQ